jgi:hypothetical protein
MNKMKTIDTHSVREEDREPLILHRADWASHHNLWKGHLEGKSLGTEVTVLFFATEEVGEGPR